MQRLRVEGGIEVVRLDRPERRNALDSATLASLLEVLDELAASDEVRVLVFSTTNVRALSAGADISEPLDAAGGVARMEAFSRFYAAVEAFPAVTIAVCVGNCVGGGVEGAARRGLRGGGDKPHPALGGGGAVGV